MSLQDEIDSKSKEIQTDGYRMSIGELINMYTSDVPELDIHPEFQRFFRWTDTQKARFIESILLGIPIPPIFVSQGEGGIWDVIDGLQRISTIFEFVGILMDEDGKPVTPTRLKATKFLPSLQDKVWNNKYELENSFTSEQRINFKRSKLDINIIKKTSDKDAKYELFQRINSGGTSLTEQEHRNCLIIMINRDFYIWAKKLSEFEPFKNCLPLSDKQIREQYDMEILIRFLVYRHINLDEINGNEDIGDFLTDKLVELIESKEFDFETEEDVFKRTFSYLDELLAEDSFKKYDSNKGVFKGACLISSFEAIIVGISENIDNIITRDTEEVINIIKGIYVSEAYMRSTVKGTRPINRFKVLTINSREIFA